MRRTIENHQLQGDEVRFRDVLHTNVGSRTRHDTASGAEKSGRCRVFGDLVMACP